MTTFNSHPDLSLVMQIESPFTPTEKKFELIEQVRAVAHLKGHERALTIDVFKLLVAAQNLLKVYDDEPGHDDIESSIDALRAACNPIQKIEQKQEVPCRLCLMTNCAGGCFYG